MIMNVKKGDYIYHSLNMYQNLVALIDAYNIKVAGSAGAKPISRKLVKKHTNNVVEFPC